MIKKVIAAGLLVILFTVAVVQAMEKDGSTPVVKSTPGINVGEKALDFTLKDLSGNEVSLSDYKGKKIMLNFWATWCPPCKAEMPDMQKLYEKHKDELIILAVNLDPQNDVSGFVTDMGLTFPILLEGEAAVNEQYKIISIPTSFFIDEKGVIRSKSVGSINLETMEEYLKEL